MNSFDHAFYMQQQQRKLDAWERNQRIQTLHLFKQAEGRGIIRIMPDASVDIITAPHAFHHFRFHPEILTPDLAQAFARQDQKRLAKALSDIYRSLV